jgi:hypothetical protein
MDRRKSIKALLIGTASTGIMLDACKTDDKKRMMFQQSQRLMLTAWRRKKPLIKNCRRKSFSL